MSPIRDYAADTRKVGGVTAHELKLIVREAIQEEFIACGLLASTHAEKAEMQEDFRYLRWWRLFVEGAATKIGYTVIGLFVTAVGGLLMLGFNAKIGK